MTRNQSAFVVAFLQELSERFSNDGCNDLYLSDTPENRELVEASDKYAIGEDAAPVEVNEGKIDANNQHVLDYLTNLLKTEAGLTDDEIPSVG